MNPTTLFLIGNGFDTAHKLPTSYSCFRTFLCEQYNVDEDSYALVPQSTQYPDGSDRYDADEVASYIVQVIDMAAGENWGNLESCLGFRLYQVLQFDLREINYEDDDNDMWNDTEVNGQLASGLWYTFEEMKRQFYRWVKERLSVIDYEDAAENPYTEEIRSGIKKLLTAQDREKTAFLCFNYSYTLQKVYGISEDRICQIHGTVDGSEESMLFGHGDESDIENQLINEVGSEYELGALKRYLQKDTQQALIEHSEFFDRLDQVKAVYSYGFSFSDADMTYLDEIEKHINPGDVIWYLNHWDVEKNPGFKDLLEERGYQVELAEW